MSPLEADGGRRMDRLFVVRRGHPEATMKLGTTVVNGGGSQRGKPSPSLYVSSLFAWVVVVNGDSRFVGLGGGGERWWILILG